MKDGDNGLTPIGCSIGDPKKGSVLVVGNFLSASGGSRGVCEDLSIKLAESGWQVFTSSVYRSGLRRLADMVCTAVRHRRRYKVALVEVYSGPAFVWAEVVGLTLRLLGKKVVLNLHGGNLPIFAKARGRRVKRLLNSASIITAPSRYLQENLRGLDSRIQIIPNAIDLARYPYRERSVVVPRLVWLRSFHGIYNPVMASRVVSRLVGEFPKLSLAMIGPDKGDGSFEKVKAEVGKLGLQQHFSFPGPVQKSNVPNELSQHDVFLNTTNFDNTPVSVVEAMACGLCLVSTNVGGVPYLVDDMLNGLLVSPDDDQAMATRVRSILLDPELARSLSRAARSKAAGMSWSEVIPRWESIIGSILSKPVG